MESLRLNWGLSHLLASDPTHLRPKWTRKLKAASFGPFTITATLSKQTDEIYLNPPSSSTVVTRENGAFQASPPPLGLCRTGEAAENIYVQIPHRICGSLFGVR